MDKEVDQAMKVLFLDIDGVLNSSHFLEDLKSGQDAICPDMVAQINKVTDATSCKIVISSTWRLYWDLEDLIQILRKYGLTGDVIDKTPDWRSGRDDEILAWLTKHPGVSRFAVVDDSAKDLVKVKDNFVHTSFVHGIQSHHADALIALLNHDI
jgi:hypothetical protein